MSLITVITVRGTGEIQGSPNSMLTAVTKHLDPTRYSPAIDLAYPASIGPAGSQGFLGDSENESIEVGVQALAAAIRATPNKVGLCGYSLGAMVVSRFLERRAGEFPDCEVEFAGCLANPLRRAGGDVGNICAPDSYGIAGQRRMVAVPVFEVANPADGITSCPPQSPLRTLADQISGASIADLNAWGDDLLRRAITGDWQPTAINPCDPVATVESYWQAVGLLEGYLIGGAHTQYHLLTMPGTQVTYTQLLAQLINEGNWT